MPHKLITKLLPHQEEAVSFHIQKKFSANFSEMGTGKSLVALAVICELGKKAAIVCPPHLVNNWLNEVNKHTELVATPHFLKVKEDADVAIIPYSQIAKCEGVFKWADVIVADESHYLKNMNAKRTITFHAFFSKHTPEYFLPMTGTPLKNRIPEAYSMLVLFSYGPNSPKITDAYRSFYTFCCRFTNVRETSYGNQYTGMKNVEELRTYIKPFSIKHYASKVLNLPELTEVDVIASYDDNPDLERAFARFQEEGVGADITVKRDSAVAKAKFTSNFVSDSIEAGSSPVVVFSDHKKPLEIMALELSASYRVAVIDGDTNMANRQMYVDRLNKGQLDALLCTIGTSSSGYNMTGASLLVINDPPWVPGDRDQLIKRIHRLGQEKPCRIVNVIGSKVDQKIQNSLRGKNRVINKVINQE